MNSLDRLIKRGRKQRYKRLKKLFKARDMASKYINRTIRVSLLDKNLPANAEDEYFTVHLAKIIIDAHLKMIGLRSIKPLKSPIRK